MKPMPAAQVLDQYFLEARARLLDLAAILDRIERGGNSNDPRTEKLRVGIELLTRETARAELMQQHFSLPYEAGWLRPVPGSRFPVSESQ